MDGKTIAITRSKEDAAEFIDLAQQNNATPIPLPTIELVSKGEKIVDEFLESVTEYDPDYSVFMSSKAVKLLFDTAKQVNKFEKLQLAVANTMVMSVGPKTTKALENEEDMAQTKCGTPYFMPPEVCKNFPYDAKADVWAMGVIIYELITLKKPFDC